MRKSPVVVAIACSDIHLSLKAPLARAGEPDWLEAMKRMAYEIDEIADYHDVPVLCAGDVFDRWNSSPELINWALKHLPKLYAIPGQHDLPTHNLDLIEKSAYWTLVKAGKIHNLSVGENHGYKDMIFQGFPWGVPLEPCERTDKRIHIALVHRYIWKKGKSYPGAPKDAHIRKQQDAHKGWDVVIYGDNHKGFLQEGDTTIFNCGTLLRRKSDEIGYRPQVGLILDDGTVEPHYLNIKADIITETEKLRTPEEDMELKEFLEELTKLGDSSLDFKDAMIATLNKRKPGKAVRKLIVEAME